MEKLKSFSKTIFLIFFTLLLISNSFMNLTAYGSPGNSNQPGSTSEGEVEKVPEEIASFETWYQAASNYTLSQLNQSKIPREAKALYISGHTTGGHRYEEFINLLNQTELNSLVIDVKEDSGYLTYKSNEPLVNEVESDRKTFIRDIDEIIKIANENNVYTIARIVTFKDPFYAGAKPEIAMKSKAGGVWRDRKGVSWVDPYNKDVWDYNIAIAKEAAEKGFKEIQFDYVRFPENGKKVDREVEFVNPDNLTKAENIAQFLAYAKKELSDYPVFISADVFGLTTSVRDDMGIGQQWELITSVVDYISPMMYPSHYANRTYGIPVPDANPHDTIKFGLIDAINKNKKVAEAGKPTAIIRPWYQDFTATWVSGYIPYGPKQVADQIKAGYNLDVNEYLMWDSANTYSDAAWTNLLKKK